MEQKKVTYTGVDTEDVTEQLEQGNAKLAEKGWRGGCHRRGPVGKDAGRGPGEDQASTGDLCPGRAGRG